ncbi:Threonine synthase [Candidatus Sumerlaea chitinivorans]|uniref:Threonine synthase n=1 Tax=Sumerlaea chitinivorans TaxID=2250252 RepID=A0A2Z4Y664_SUMC1|nr:Threonine synthase [Candidatus Sumerlaea chitinivorans]
MASEPWQGVIRAYREFLPVGDDTPIISLNEGNTPLIPAPALAREIGPRAEVFLKFEGLNPTGSFKDRGMTMAVTKAVEEGSSAVMCASTGNTSASAAAYAARAGLACIVIIPDGNIALGKLAQALMHGAKVFAVQGNFDDALRIVREVTTRFRITLVNSINPYRIEGQKTGSFEICDVLGDAPDFHFIPVGNAGNITAYWRGYKEYRERGRSQKLPKMMGFQAEGAAPIVRGHVVEKPETLATAIRIGNPASWRAAEAARDESGGVIDMVSDAEIVAAYQFLAQREGVFCEPASAASVAGLLKYARAGFFEPLRNDLLRIVCVLTGHGLKDPNNAIQYSAKPISVPATVEAILEHVELEPRKQTV